MFYRVRLLERFVNTHEFSTKRKYLKVGEKGIFVSYREEKELDPRFINSHLIGVKPTCCVLEADNFEEAIKSFYNEWEGAKVGGTTKKSKALWIAEGCRILEMPPCNLINRNKKGEFICGKETICGNGEFGMCVLDNCDPPDGCPIDHFESVIFEKEERGDLIERKIKINGEKFILVKASDNL